MIRYCLTFAVLLCVSAWGAEKPRVLGPVDPTLAAELSAVLTASADAETAFEARRQSRRAARVASDFLNSQGYFKAQVEPVPDGLVAAIRVDPGARFRIAQVRLLGAPDGVDWVALSVGDLALPSVIHTAADRALARARDQGYADVVLVATRVAGDAEQATVDVTYELALGPRITLGDVKFADDFPIHAEYRHALVPFETGADYAPATLAELEQRMTSTRLFSLVSASLLADGEAEQRDVALLTRSRPRYTLASGVSFSTDEGPGLTLEWTMRNPTGRGDTLVLNPSVSRDRSAMALDWSWPNALGFDRSLAFNGLIEKEKTDGFERQAETLAATLNLRVSPTLSYTLGGALEATSETDINGARDLTIVSVNGGIRLDHTDDFLNPVRGWRFDLSAEPGVLSGDASGQFIRVQSEMSAYLALDAAQSWVAAALVGGGAVFADSQLSLPASRRFYAGGGGSARGYAFQSIGPRQGGTPSGGRVLARTAFELRKRHSETLGYVWFVDAASVGQTVSDLGQGTRVGTGFGLRYFTSIGPLRADIGVPVAARDSDDPFQLYLSIGQAF
ncbi:BamA/TamA family outer membrane protein [Litorivicinus lipolyticus]|uniref:BamA/TamA family outer membrane protein n=1 Tax=Litorivicinus lipolyticus TaxID=418701 RepID=A0A5Q2QGG9_9GAMM|nr:BamA/TamA family outer membrane protein [Litorivicinus lipolyticus]QGG80105.1 BamA/TamA family outer membrane protein [Litorivicinus lipolyticus]